MYDGSRSGHRGGNSIMISSMTFLHAVVYMLMQHPFLGPLLRQCRHEHRACVGPVSPLLMERGLCTWQYLLMFDGIREACAQRAA